MFLAYMRTIILYLVLIAVGIVEHWAVIRPQLLPIALLLVASTVLTFGISGSITQLLSRKGGEKHA